MHRMPGPLGTHSTVCSWLHVAQSTSSLAPNKQFLALKTAQAHHHSTANNLIGPAGRQSELGHILSELAQLYSKEYQYSISGQHFSLMHRLHICEFRARFDSFNVAMNHVAETRTKCPPLGTCIFIRAWTQTAHSRTGPRGHAEFPVKKC